MARIALIADAHVGNHRRFGGPSTGGLNRRCWDVLTAVERASALALDEGCVALVSLGDFFDATNPNPQTLERVLRIVDVSSLEWIFLKGNHEMVSADEGDHALAPLYPLARIVDEPEVVEVDDASLCLVPFAPGPAREWIADGIAASTGFGPDDRALGCFHVGVSDASTPGYLESSHDAVSAAFLKEALQEFGLTAGAAGNWHFRREWLARGPAVLQVGALCPTGFGELGMDEYGWMAVWDSETNEFTSRRVPGPRFLRIESVDELDRVHADDELASECAFYVEWWVEPGEFSDATAELEDRRKRGEVRDFAVLPKVDHEAEEAARRAARSAGSSETLEEMLAEYVEKLELPEGIDHQSVLDGAKGYLWRS